MQVDRVNSDWDKASGQSADWKHSSRNFAFATLAFLLMFSAAAIVSWQQEHAGGLTLFFAAIGALGFLVCAVVTVSTLAIGWVTDLRNEVRARMQRKQTSAAADGTKESGPRP